jgi:chorismate mutase
MVDSNNEFLKKKWMIKTNDELFHGQYRCKVCTGGHCHGRIEGRETQKSSYYPWKMVQSFARFWAQQTVSKQQLQRMNFHDVATVEDCDGGDLLAQDEEPPGDHSMPSSLPGDAIVAANPADAPSAAERERWQAKLNHFHRSSGHCSSRNLARIVKDANLESWKVRAALDFTCPICEGLRPGGSSSGNVPPAATHAQYGPWQALGLDASEWAVPGHNVKVKFLLLIDFATRLRMAVPLMEPYPITALRTESSAQVIEVVAKSWLGTYPKPEIIIPDNGMGFSAKEFADFCRDQNIELCLPAEKEPWAHGLVENAMRELKHTASAIQMDNLAQDPTVTLALAASALNSTEFVAGFSSHQWAFGRAYTISEEDRRLFAQLGERASFASMVAARQRAEDVATKTRAQRVLTRLNNSKARQLLRHFQIADLVKVWRKICPAMPTKDLEVG